MFSCCLWANGDSSLNKDKSEVHEKGWKFMILSFLQLLWPFGQKETDSAQGGQAQDHIDKGEHEYAPKVIKEPCREIHISEDMVEKMVNHLVPSLQGRGDPFYVPTFLYSYRRFTTTRHVLDLLLKQYAYFRPDCEEDEQVKSILCSFLTMWIEKYPEEFCQTSDLSILTKLHTYLTVNMPYSDLSLRVHMLLVDLQSSESEREDEEDSELESHTSGDSEIEVLLPSVKLQLKPACAPETESPNPSECCNVEAKCDISSPASSPTSSCGTWDSPCSRHSGLPHISSLFYVLRE